MSDQHDFCSTQLEVGSSRSDNDSSQTLARDALSAGLSMHIDTAQLDTNSPDLLDETAEAFYQRLIPLCIKTARMRDSCLAGSDEAARRYLVLVASITKSPYFEAADFARRHNWRWHSSYERNHYQLVIRCTDPNRNRQVANNQSLALRYALQRCEAAGRPYQTCFDGMSINESLRLARESNKTDKREAPRSQYAVIDQVPIDLVSKKSALILVHFREGRGVYVTTVNSNDDDDYNSDMVSDDGSAENHSDAA